MSLTNEAGEPTVRHFERDGLLVSMSPADIARVVAAEAAHQVVEVYKGDSVWETHRDGVQVLCLLLGRGAKARVAAGGPGPAQGVTL